MVKDISKADLSALLRLLTKPLMSKYWILKLSKILQISKNMYIKIDLINTWKTKQILVTFYKKMWVKKFLSCLLTMKTGCPFFATLHFCHDMAFILFIVTFVVPKSECCKLIKKIIESQYTGILLIRGY